MRLLAALVLCSIATLPAIARNAVRASDDDAAIREVVRKYVDAREKRDPTLLAALFTEDADQITTSGEWRRGRDNVVRGGLASSQSNPGARQITIEAVRFLAPGVAIADGRYEIRGSQAGDQRRMWTTFVLMRGGSGEWRVAAIRNMVPTGALPASQEPAAASGALDYEYFKTKVQPIFVAKRAGHARCIACHGSGTPLRLQPLAPGATTWNDEDARKNFEAVRRVVVPGSVTKSRLLVHPLTEEAGGDFYHSGGKHWSSQNDDEWRTLKAWVLGQTTK
jgi:uncharacterized protein (TIGR02246 family)